MSARVWIEYIYSAYCEDCAWGGGVISTTEEQAERMVAQHNAENHREQESGSSR